MSFAVPLGLVALITLPVIVVLYMLRARRRTMEVPNLFLWQGLVRQAPEKASWKVPIRNPLLWMQLFIALALALALAQPLTRWLFAGQEHHPRNVILLVDASASMLATDVAPTRLAEAQRRAGALIDSLHQGDTASLVRVGRDPTIVAQGDDRQLLRETLDSIGAGDQNADMMGAIRLSQTLLKSGFQNEVHVLSAGRFDRTSAVTLRGATLQFDVIGHDSENRGITAFSVKALVDGSGRCDAFAVVQNFTQSTASIPLSATVDHTVADSRLIQLDPGGSYNYSFMVPAGGHLVEVGLGGQDELPHDDHVQGFCATDRSLDVLLVSDTPEFLSAAIGAVPGVRIAQVTTGSYNPSMPAHLTVFENYVPDRLPDGNLLFVNPPASSSIFHVTGQLTSPAITFYDQSSPLLQNIDVQNLPFSNASAMQLPSWATAVARSADYPLILDGTLQGHQAVAFAFGVQNSSLPLRVVFPVLVSNALSYLDPVGLPAAIGIGQPIALKQLGGAQTASVNTPGGRTETVQVGKGNPQYSHTLDPGVYRITYNRNGKDLGYQEVAVNLLSPSQSDIAPQADEVVEVVGPADLGASATTTVDLWQPMVLAALGMLAIEWLYYHLRARG